VETQFFNLIIRNNSIQNAYNVKIYAPKGSYFKFKNETNSLEPLVISNPKNIEMVFTIKKEITFSEAEKLQNYLNSEELKQITLIVEYQNEQRRSFYSKFSTFTNNERLKNKPDVSNLRLI
jgi:methionine aminopeptidase